MCFLCCWSAESHGCHRGMRKQLHSGNKIRQTLKTKTNGQSWHTPRVTMTCPMVFNMLWVPCACWAYRFHMDKDNGPKLTLRDWHWAPGEPADRVASPKGPQDHWRTPNRRKTLIWEQCEGTHLSKSLWAVSQFPGQGFTSQTCCGLLWLGPHRELFSQGSWLYKVMAQTCFLGWGPCLVEASVGQGTLPFSLPHQVQLWVIVHPPVVL